MHCQSSWCETDGIKLIYVKSGYKAERKWNFVPAASVFFIINIFPAFCNVTHASNKRVSGVCGVFFPPTGLRVVQDKTE